MKKQIIIQIPLLVSVNCNKDTMIDEALVERLVSHFSDSICLDIDVEEYGHPEDGEIAAAWLNIDEAKAVNGIKWFVVKSGSKYDDGFFGWDATIHDEEQIYQEGSLPYKENTYEFIQVGDGKKPTVEEVQDILATT